MQSRETRFVLRIESGERQGEQVPLGEGAFLIGRRPECALILQDGSVSGRHAELRVADARVELVDLGSTNGTRVGGQKVQQALLSHGDVVLLGNIRVTLHDARLAGTPAAALLESAAGASPAPGEGGGGLEQVSAEMLRRSGRGSKAFLIVALGLVLLGAGAYAYLRFGKPGAEVGATVVIPEVPGNLLADGSFEEGTAEWGAAETAPVVFQRERGFAASGEDGLGVTLGRDAEGAQAGWSLAHSPEIVLHARRSLAVGGSLRVDDGALGRLGVELASASGELPAFLAWAPARPAGAGFAPCELAFDVPGGYDRARVVVAGALAPGANAGSVALDDVHALEQDPLGGTAKFAEYELSVLGSPGSCAALVRSGRTLLTGFDLSAWSSPSWSSGAPEGWAEARLRAEAGPRGFQLSFEGAPHEASLRFVGLRPDEGSSPQGAWAATTGAGGYAAYGGDFTRAGVTSLLLGSGTELLRMGFERPVEVVAQAVPGGMAFRVALGGLERCELQLAFAEERASASALADRATDAERAHDLGQALALWSELLDRFPFERRLILQASETRARLIQVGLNRVDELRREMERARFFLLPELFEKGKARAEELEAQYRGSEVEGEAKKVAEQCRMALTELLSGRKSGDARRLQGVLETLDPARAPGLAELVRTSLEAVDRRGGGD